MLWDKLQIMENSEDKARSIISDICEERNIFLLKADIIGGARNRRVRIICDTEPGITINQCRQLGGAIQDMFLRKDIFADGYEIEVSSPGVDKPLEHAFEYKRNIGRELNVEYDATDEIKHAVGKLVAFDGSVLTLEAKKDTFEIPMAAIKHAKIKLKW